MKIKQMYFEDFIKKCEKKGFSVNYNDNSGIYYISDINIYIKAWNGKIALGNDFDLNELNNFLKLYNEVKYYIELEDETNE